jgi:hypothetical protein
MSVDLSMINANLIFWIVAILVIILIFGIVRFFFRHLLHLLFRGCGLILVIAALLYILHVFKVF